MQILEKFFDTALHAPDGIKKLRELILTLAMQGKLVAQDPNDQPASELIKEIEKEKQQLIKEKKIKKINQQLEIKLDKIGFEIPSSWEWVKFGNIAHLITDGAHHTPTYINEGVPFLSVKDMSSGTLNFSNTRYISHKQHKDLAKRCNPQKGDLLLTKVGTTGIPILINTDKEFSIFVSVALIKFPKQFISGDFLVWLVNSPFVKKQSADGTEGVGNKNLVLKKINNFSLPIPPLNEQKRIVEKINQLMSLCDELEKLKQQKEAKKLTVHKSAISQLLDSKDESNSQKGWHFISNHFNELYTVKENVSELKSAILQLAMQGKLISQDPNDQSASELLKEIEKEKKANKVKLLEPIKSESIPYNLPNGWEWIYLNDFGVWKSGSTPSRTNSAYYEGDIPWVKSGEVKQGLIKNTKETITQKALDECSLGLNPVGSVLVAMYGANIGEVGILEVEATTNQAICACQTFSKINNQFLKFLLDSLKGYFISQGAGAAQPNISRVKIINSIVPLPPFNEQERIVEKINQLMALCDDLEKQIENSSSKQTELLSAILSNLGK
jgi:type I restriction enzyme S subunit